MIGKKSKKSIGNSSIDFIILQVVITTAMIIVGINFLYTERRIYSGTVGAIIITTLAIIYDTYLIKKTLKK